MTTSSTTPLAVPKPIDPPAGATKTVTFSCIGGVWSADVSTVDSAYFTDRDFNQMAILLTVKRAAIRRLAWLDYQKKMRANSPKAAELTVPAVVKK